MPRETAVFPGDDARETVHVVAVDGVGGGIVGCATMLKNSWEGEPAWQVRGMAVSPTLQRSGVGGLLLAFGRDSFFMWDTMSMVLPLFAITLAVEIPMLRHLYRRVSPTWRRACALGAGVNVVSYACVFIVEIALLFGWLSYTTFSTRYRGRSNEPTVRALRGVRSGIPPTRDQKVSVTHCCLLRIAAGVVKLEIARLRDSYARSARSRR